MLGVYHRVYKGSYAGCIPQGVPRWCICRVSLGGYMPGIPRVVYGPVYLRVVYGPVYLRVVCIPGYPRVVYS